MKIAVTCLVSIFIINLSVPAYSQKRYSSGAYSELSAERTYLQRVSDWFATVGKTQEEKAVILSQRQAKRNIVNKQKMIERKKKEIEKQKKKFKSD